MPFRGYIISKLYHVTALACKTNCLSTCPLLRFNTSNKSLVLDVHQRVVGPPLALGDQLVVRALLNDRALLHNGDDVSMTHGREAVGDDQGGSAHHEAVEGVLDNALRLGVKRRSGLVLREKLTRA
jgi:hypothetical protein